MSSQFTSDYHKVRELKGTLGDELLQMGSEDDRMNVPGQVDLYAKQLKRLFANFVVRCFHVGFKKHFVANNYTY